MVTLSVTTWAPPLPVSSYGFGSGTYSLLSMVNVSPAVNVYA